MLCNSGEIKICGFNGSQWDIFVTEPPVTPLKLCIIDPFHKKNTEMYLQINHQKSGITQECSESDLSVFYCIYLHLCNIDNGIDIQRSM